MELEIEPTHGPCGSSRMASDASPPNLLLNLPFVNQLQRTQSSGEAQADLSSAPEQQILLVISH